MSSIKDNKIFDQTSFLEGSNSNFIEDLYLKYIQQPEEIPQSWKDFFEGLNEDQKVIESEIQSPSWAPKKKITFKKKIKSENLIKNSDEKINTTLASQENYEKEKEQSVKAIALIRAYRIRGHLIAKLDPLGLMERKYLYELHPSEIEQRV